MLPGSLHSHFYFHYDLFDRQPHDPGSDSALQSAQPQDGRSVGAKLELKF